jgi:hypothetical protein
MVVCDLSAAVNHERSMWQGILYKATRRGVQASRFTRKASAVTVSLDSSCVMRVAEIILGVYNREEQGLRSILTAASLHLGVTPVTLSAETWKHSQCFVPL